MDSFYKDWKWVFNRIDYREHSSILKSKLLYKRGSSRGTDKTPTCKTANDPARSFKQKILAWFLKNQNSTFLNEKNKEFIKMISSELKSKTDLISVHPLIAKKGFYV